MAKSHSQSRLIASRYANALFSLAKEQSVITVISDELLALARDLKHSSEFALLCHSPALSTSQKAEMITSVAKKMGVSSLAMDFLGVLAMKRRLPLLPIIAEEYAKLRRMEAGEALVRVASPEALDTKTMQEMQAQLSKALHKQVTIENQIDASLIGGVTIRYGSLELDASVKGKLAKAAQRLYEGIANAA